MPRSSRRSKSALRWWSRCRNPARRPALIRRPRLGAPRHLAQLSFATPVTRPCPEPAPAAPDQARRPHALRPRTRRKPSERVVRLPVLTRGPRRPSPRGSAARRRASVPRPRRIGSRPRGPGARRGRRRRLLHRAAPKHGGSPSQATQRGATGTSGDASVHGAPRVGSRHLAGPRAPLAGRQAVLTRERAVERELGLVTHPAGDRRDRRAGVGQQPRR
jgi:hypothetical protein